MADPLPTAADRQPSATLSYLFAAGVALAPPLILLTLFDARLAAVGLGAASWVGGFVAKQVAAGIAYLSVPESRAQMHATAAGLASSASELGVAAVLFHFYGQSFSAADILAFAAGAGAMEAVLLLGAAFMRKTPDDEAEAWVRGAARSACVRYGFFIERTITVAGHIGSRGLICVAVSEARYELALIALATFAVTDGVAAYGLARKWSWFEPEVCRRFYALCAAISAIEVGLLALVL